MDFDFIAAARGDAPAVGRVHQGFRYGLGLGAGLGNLPGVTTRFRYVFSASKKPRVDRQAASAFSIIADVLRRCALFTQRAAPPQPARDEARRVRAALTRPPPAARQGPWPAHLRDGPLAGRRHGAPVRRGARAPRAGARRAPGHAIHFCGAAHRRQALCRHQRRPAAQARVRSPACCRQRKRSPHSAAPGVCRHYRVANAIDIVPRVPPTRSTWLPGKPLGALEGLLGLTIIDYQHAGTSRLAERIVQARGPAGRTASCPHARAVRRPRAARSRRSRCRWTTPPPAATASRPASPPRARCASAWASWPGARPAAPRCRRCAPRAPPWAASRQCGRARRARRSCALRSARRRRCGPSPTTLSAPTATCSGRLPESAEPGRRPPPTLGLGARVQCSWVAEMLGALAVHAGAMPAS